MASKLRVIPGGAPADPQKGPKHEDYEPVLGPDGRPIPGFRRHVSSGIITFRKTFKAMGIPALSVSTGETTIGKAKTKAKVLETEWVNRHLGIDSGQKLGLRKNTDLKTFGQVAREVLESYTPDQRGGTRALHQFYIGELIKEWDAIPLDSITEKFYLDWLKGFRERKAARARMEKRKPRQTFMDYAKAANVVLHFAYRNRYTSNRITFRDPDTAERNRKLNRIIEKRRRGVSLTREEVEVEALKKCRLLSSAEVARLWAVMGEDLRDEFVLAFECMMRLREALHLEWDRVDLETGLIILDPEHVKTGSKTGKGRRFIMTAKALERMRARHARIGARTRWVFPGWSKSDPTADKPVNSNKTAWRGAKAKAGITRQCRWHDLRHTALTFALLGDPDATPAERAKMTKDPWKVSEYAGVSMRTIQSVYLHSNEKLTADVADRPSTLD